MHSNVSGQARIASDAAGVEAIVPARAETLLPEGLLQDDEIVILLLRPSLVYVPLSCFTSVLFVGFAAVFLAYLARTMPWIPWTDTQAFALGVFVGAMRLGWQGLEWYSRVYVLTDRRIIRRMGVLRMAVFQTELKHIQHTSVFALLRERLFGLGTIGFATAGSDVFEVYWVMIRRPFAVHKIVVDTIQRYGRKDYGAARSER